MVLNYCLLLPNSEGKAKGKNESLIYREVLNKEKYNRFFKLQPSRNLIIDEIKSIIKISSEKELSNFFDLKGNNLKEAVSTMGAIEDETCMEGIDRMSGVMYESIDYNSLNNCQKINFNDSVIILDALFGLLSPLDQVPNYKCKISMRLFGSNLAKFWQKELHGYFKSVCEDKLVIDLLPNSHKEMFKKEVNVNRVEIVFAKKKGDSYQLEGHMSKKLKGEFVRFVISYNSISREDLKLFKHSNGHSFSEEFSNENKFVFLIQ